MQIKIIILALFSSVVCCSQNTYTKDNLANIVVCIADQKGNETRPSGTGTIINDNNEFYIITAAHIVDSIKGNCMIVFKIDNDQSVTIPLIQFTNTYNSSWIKHPEADIACIKIFPNDSGAFKRLKNWSIPKSQILKDKTPIPRDFSVLAIGFPLIDVIGKYFSPFTFNSNFSSGYITLPRGDTKQLTTFQVLENPSVQGYSGGPIFVGIKKNGVSVGPKYTVLVGIMHGTHADNTGGKMALITPSYFIFDLIK